MDRNQTPIDRLKEKILAHLKYHRSLSKFKLRMITGHYDCYDEVLAELIAAGVIKQRVKKFSLTGEAGRSAGFRVVV
jgi:hypothetical protein